MKISKSKLVETISNRLQEDTTDKNLISLVLDLYDQRDSVDAQWKDILSRIFSDPSLATDDTLKSQYVSLNAKSSQLTAQIESLLKEIYNADFIYGDPRADLRSKL